MAIAGGPALGKMLRWCQCFILWEEIWHIVASQDEGYTLWIFVAYNVRRY